MKKSLALLLAVAFFGSDAAATVFSIDSTRILRESREGRQILASNEKDKKMLMDVEMKESQKVGKLREDIENGMRAGKFTQASIQVKYEELNRAQRRAKHVIEDAREDLKIKEQRKVIAFRGKVHQVAGEFFEKKGDCAVLDQATPGVIYLAKSIDRTDDLLKEINVRHEKNKAKLALTKSNGKADKKSS